jgi:hypothetical protein
MVVIRRRDDSLEKERRVKDCLIIMLGVDAGFVRAVLGCEEGTEW